VEGGKNPLHHRLGSPELRRLVESVVRRRVPEREVDDLVQTVLCDALASESIPEDDDALRRWLIGVARHKVADLHRKGARGQTVELPDELPDAHPTEVQAVSTRDLARWADEQVEGNPTAKRTLEWLEREGEGETLADLAAEAKLPPDQVRQRVSRLRRFLKERWARELAAVAAVLTVAVALVWWSRSSEEVAEPTHAPPSPQRPAGPPTSTPPSATPFPSAAPTPSPSSSGTTAPTPSAVPSVIPAPTAKPLPAPKESPTPVKRPPPKSLRKIPPSETQAPLELQKSLPKK
jgi:DNA-directed RNA polymerase specialized sigma24 family protein